MSKGPSFNCVQMKLCVLKLTIPYTGTCGVVNGKAIGAGA